jgi:hypothetical protein
MENKLLRFVKQVVDNVSVAAYVYMLERNNRDLKLLNNVFELSSYFTRRNYEGLVYEIPHSRTPDFEAYDVDALIDARTIKVSSESRSVHLRWGDIRRLSYLVQRVIRRVQLEAAP